jgi:hypothetical protein
MQDAQHDDDVRFDCVEDCVRKLLGERSPDASANHRPSFWMINDFVDRIDDALAESERALRIVSDTNRALREARGGLAAGGVSLDGSIVSENLGPHLGPGQAGLRALTMLIETAIELSAKLWRKRQGGGFLDDALPNLGYQFEPLWHWKASDLRDVLHRL